MEVPTLISNHYSTENKGLYYRISNPFILLKTKDSVPKIAVEAY